MHHPLPQIAFVTLGGTISSVPSVDGGSAKPTLSGAELFSGIAGLTDLAELTAIPFRTYPSGDLTIDDIVELAALITAKAAEGYAGVVITQGTDTLEETAFLLELLLPPTVPIVLTGAMRNPGLPGADGPANVLAAVRVAVSGEAVGLGPLVVFDDEIHLPRTVRKLHTSSTGAFVSPALGPIGWVIEDRVRIPVVPRNPLPTFVPTALGAELPVVAVRTLGLGSGAEVLAADGLDGLVLETFGGGHAPAALMPGLRALAARIPVIFASRAGAGELYRSTYGFPGSEEDLLASGLISAGVLGSTKARLLLIAALAAGRDRSALVDDFLGAL